MKTKVEFEFNLPEEQDDLDTTMNAWKYRAALHDVFEQFFRLDKNDDRRTAFLLLMDNYDLELP